MSGANPVPRAQTTFLTDVGEREQKSRALCAGPVALGEQAGARRSEGGEDAASHHQAIAVIKNRGNQLRCVLLNRHSRRWSESMRYALTALLTVSALTVFSARSEEIEAGTNLASLEQNITGSSDSAVYPGSERNTALIKEGEFETPETIAIIEKNREDRERMVVMDR